MIFVCVILCFFFFSSRRRHTRFDCDWSSDVCSSDLCRLFFRAICARVSARCRAPRMSSSWDEGVWLTPLSTSRPTSSNSEPGGKKGEKTSKACLTALSLGPRLLPMAMIILGILCLGSSADCNGTPYKCSFHGEFLEIEENSPGRIEGFGNAYSIAGIKG